MSFNYLKDLFGKFRKRKTKYSKVEQEAISLLRRYANKDIGKDEFGEAMDAVRQKFHDLMLNEKDGTYVFNADTPGWLNLFLANKFIPWNRARRAIAALRARPDLTEEQRHEVKEIETQKELDFMRAVEYCLKERR